jgi:hypothetical protein
MIKFLAGSCLSGLVRLGRIRDRYERTIGDLTLAQTDHRHSMLKKLCL